MGDRGDIISEATSLAFYGSYYNNKNYFTDWIIGFGKNNYDTTRNINYNGFAYQVAGDTHGNQYSISVSGTIHI